MQEVTGPSIERMERRRFLLEIIAVCCTVLVGELALASVDALVPGPTPASSYVVVASGAGLAGVLAVGLWLRYRTERRMRRILETAQGWLRGTLSLRIGECVEDRLGLLADQLDILAEHLEQDERDLTRLRHGTMRQTDQVRALAIDEERERLARELHDGVKQHLFSLSMTASALCARMEDDADPELLEMAREVEKTSGTVQRTLTRLVEDLRPTPLQEQGLAAALNDYALLFGAREHVLVYVDVHGNDALLPPTTAETLYRVAQEALHNVARHARATRIEVSLRCLPEQAILDVGDNGIGFDTDQVRRGLGLGNMQDRMLLVGGRLSIDSRIGHGTHVRAEVRLTRPQSLHRTVRRGDGSPLPTRENWAWLGQRLVIPVGQEWPWPLAEEAYLRRPLIEPERGPIRLQRSARLLGLGQTLVLRDGSGLTLLEMRQHRWGYRWRSGGAEWTLHHVVGPRGTLRAVLARNEQPLAAMQHRGRLLDIWSELLYDGAGYRLAHGPVPAGGSVLMDGDNIQVLWLRGIQRIEITLHRPVPLPLLALVAIRSTDDWSVALEAGVGSEAGTASLS